MNLILSWLWQVISGDVEAHPGLASASIQTLGSAAVQIRQCGASVAIAVRGASVEID